MYNKLFGKVVDSSIWLESTPTRLLWLMLIGIMDEDGYVQMATTENLARRARLSHAHTLKALATLEAPDPQSSNPEREGRRLERVPGGWMVLNAGHYKRLVTADKVREQTRTRVRAHRDARDAGDANSYAGDANIVREQARQRMRKLRAKRRETAVTHGNANVTPSESGSRSESGSEVPNTSDRNPSEGRDVWRSIVERLELSDYNRTTFFDPCQVWKYEPGKLVVNAVSMAVGRQLTNGFKNRIAEAAQEIEPGLQVQVLVKSMSVRAN